MNDEILQEFYDLVYEQAIEDTMEYMEEQSILNETVGTKIDAALRLGKRVSNRILAPGTAKRNKQLNKVKKLRDKNTPKAAKKANNTKVISPEKAKDLNKMRRRTAAGVVGGAGAYKYGKGKGKEEHRTSNNRSNAQTIADLHARIRELEAENKKRWFRK